MPASTPSNDYYAGAAQAELKIYVFAIREFDPAAQPDDRKHEIDAE